MNNTINRLVHFSLQKGLIKEPDIDYSVNQILDILKISDFYKVEISEEIEECSHLLDDIIMYAIEKGLIENTLKNTDFFSARIMNCFLPRPSEVVSCFEYLYKLAPKKATDYFYNLSISSNYIQKSRVDKNISFEKTHPYGTFVITINLSKPEKDPKDIEKESHMQGEIKYPKCVLCKENVGFHGNVMRESRANHRIIPITLHNEEYYLQYSPYVYYNEHCIVLSKEHRPMKIDYDTFAKLLDFVDMFPHYTIGSNADLPLVGGSILSHDHFQGGNYNFPIVQAKVLQQYIHTQYPSVAIQMLEWPVSSIRLISSNKEELLLLSDTILESWKHYDNPKLDIQSSTNGELHQTITPIVRKIENKYQMDLALRNNRRNETYPEGIFHPHKELHHIKKENIGLIEVMGLAILPGRLQQELALLKDCLLDKKDIDDYEIIEKHKQWYVTLRQTYEINQSNVERILQKEIGSFFVRVLEDVGVFKNDDKGLSAFHSFITSINGIKLKER